MIEATTEQRILAMDLLHLLHQLSGRSYSESDVIRLTKRIARHAWLDRQLADLHRAMMPAHTNPSPIGKDQDYGQ